MKSLTVADGASRRPKATRSGPSPAWYASPGLVMFLVVVFWGVGPPVSKLITAPAVIAVTYRFWLSVPVLFLLARMQGHPPRWATLRRTIVPGAAFGINLVFVFLTLGEAPVAVLSVMAALQPGIILLVAGPFLGERPTLWHVLWTVVGVGGTVIVVLGGGGRFVVTSLAIFYALTSQLFFTIYFLLTRRVRSEHDIDAVEWMAGVVLFAALAVTPWALATSSREDYLAVDGLDWLWLATIIVFTGGLGHVMMAWVHGYIPASRSSLYLLSMNVVAIGTAWVIHDEPLSLLQLLGGVVVFAAVAAVVSRPARTD